jgi:hypothetical protein
MLNTKHNDLAKLLCEFAREAGMRANCAQIAVELPTPGVTEDNGETAENKKVARMADVRIEAEEGHPVTWIDVAVHCSMQSCRGDPKPNKAGRAVRQGEQAKYRQWGLSPKDPTRKEGRLIPAIFESQGRMGGKLVARTPKVGPYVREETLRRRGVRRERGPDGRAQKMAPEVERDSSERQRGSFRASMGCQVIQGDPESLFQVLV